MKKALHFVIASLLFSTIAQAQITKGKILFGGTLAYGKGTSENINPVSTDEFTQNGLIINPSVGMVISDNKVLGVQLSYYSSKQENKNNNSKSESNAYGGGVFLRHYIPLLKSFYFFGQGDAGFAKTKTLQQAPNTPGYSGNGWGASLSVSPGLAYAVTKKFHIEAGLNELAAVSYNQSKTEMRDINNNAFATSKKSSFGLSTSLSGNTGFSIGFKLLL